MTTHAFREVLTCLMRLAVSAPSHKSPKGRFLYERSSQDLRPMNTISISHLFAPVNPLSSYFLKKFLTWVYRGNTAPTVPRAHRCGVGAYAHI